MALSLRLSLLVLALCTISPAAAQEDFPAPVRPATPPPWAQWLALGPSPAQVGWAFDGYDPYLAPDGGLRMIFASSEGPTVNTYVFLPTYGRDVNTRPGRVWAYFHRGRFDAWQQGECFGKMEYWNLTRGEFWMLGRFEMAPGTDVGWTEFDFQPPTHWGDADEVDFQVYVRRHQPGHHCYALVSLDGTGIVPVAGEPGPDVAALALTAAPNPVRGAAVVGYTLPAAGPVRLVLLDVLGREVAVFAEGARAAGPHAAVLDASGLAPGVYLLRLEAGGAVATRRVTVGR